MNPAKTVAMRLLPRLPPAIDRGLTELLFRAGFCSLAYRTYVRCGRPLVVQGGPFRGMSYIPKSPGSMLYPKIFGTYERELHPSIEDICREPFDLLINIGSAEGYYAIGMLLRIPGLLAQCYEANNEARRCVSLLARVNNVEARVEIAGTCTAGDLNRALERGKKTLVVCDCEGCEEMVLDPSAAHAPRLAAATILVETHDFLRAGLTEKLIERFAPTHSIRRIDMQPRPHAVPNDRFALTAAESDAVMNEWRIGDQSWLVLRPHGGVTFAAAG